MGILGIPNTRVTDRFIRYQLLGQTQASQFRLLGLQTQLSTGQKFQEPSEAPAAAQRVVDLQRILARNGQVKSNLSIGQSYLSMSDSALSQVSNLINEVRGSVLSVVGSTASDAQRRAVAEQARLAVQQLVATGNQRFRGRYLFTGSATGIEPFQIQGATAVAYQGNENRLESFGSIDSLFDTNLQGNEVFGAVSEVVRGTVDLDPGLAFDTPLADLRHGQGITRGKIVIFDGENSRVVDLSKAETIGDVARLIRASPPEGNLIEVEIGARGLVIEAAHGNLAIEDLGGTTAQELGILVRRGTSSGPKVVGADLEPALRPATLLADVLGSQARAVLRPPGPDNDIVVRADHNGADLNGVTVSVVDDGSVLAGREKAVFDPDAKTLTIYVRNNVSTAREAIEAVNRAHQLDPAAMPFTAAMDPLDDQRGGEGTISAPLTPAVVMHDGAGLALDLVHGLQIVNGPSSKTIDLSRAGTVEDLLNAINGSGIGVLAAINGAGTGIDVRTRLSGADFSIGENGGVTASQLGIRTFDADTLLAQLNHGRGVRDYEGLGATDFSITRNDGVTFEIDVRGATTVGDVIRLINENPINSDPSLGVPLVARVALFGNGIELVDDSVGPGPLTVTRLHDSSAAIDLGLVAPGEESRSSSTSGAQPDLLTGRDVNPRETAGMFTALIRLEQALLANDPLEIERAMAMLDETTAQMNFARAELGARQQGLDVLQSRLDTEEVELKKNLSDEYDVDLAQVISDLTAQQVALQASLQATATATRLTLLDYL